MSEFTVVLICFIYDKPINIFFYFPQRNYYQFRNVTTNYTHTHTHTRTHARTHTRKEYDQELQHAQINTLRRDIRTQTRPNRESPAQFENQIKPRMYVKLRKRFAKFMLHVSMWPSLNN